MDQLEMKAAIRARLVENSAKRQALRDSTWMRHNQRAMLDLLNEAADLQQQLALLEGEAPLLGT